MAEFRILCPKCKSTNVELIRDRQGWRVTTVTDARIIHCLMCGKFVYGDEANLELARQHEAWEQAQAGVVKLPEPAPMIRLVPRPPPVRELPPLLARVPPVEPAPAMRGGLSQLDRNVGDAAVALAQDLLRRLGGLNFTGDGVRLANMLRIDSNSIIYERPRMNASTVGVFARYRDEAQAQFDALGSWIEVKKPMRIVRAEVLPEPPAPRVEVRVEAPVIEVRVEAPPEVIPAPPLQEAPALGKCAWTSCQNSARKTSKYCSTACSVSNSRALDALRKGHNYVAGGQPRQPKPLPVLAPPREKQVRPARPPSVRPPRTVPMNRDQLRARLKELGTPFTWNMSSDQLREALLKTPPTVAQVPAPPVASVPEPVVLVSEPTVVAEDTPDVSKMSREKMRPIARALGVHRFAKLTPDELRRAIVKARAQHIKRAG